MASNGKAEPRQQYAALPWRVTNGVEVMLITSRQTRRWVIPKGWPIEDLLPHESAAREAFEEAGVEGEIATLPFGRFAYDKQMKDGTVQPCQVDVFAFHVAAQLADWPEKHERETRWYPASQAARLVGEPDLADLIRRFAVYRLR